MLNCRTVPASHGYLPRRNASSAGVRTWNGDRRVFRSPREHKRRSRAAAEGLYRARLAGDACLQCRRLAGALLFSGGIWMLRSPKLALRPFEVDLTRARLARDGLGDLVNEIRNATMKNDRAHIQFDSSNNMQSRLWDVRLREADAVLTWEARGKSWGWRDGSFVVPKDEFRILTKPSWFGPSSRRATIFIGRRRFNGGISVESAERFERWKAI